MTRLTTRSGPQNSVCSIVDFEAALSLDLAGRTADAVPNDAHVLLHLALRTPSPNPTRCSSLLMGPASSMISTETDSVGLPLDRIGHQHILGGHNHKSMHMADPQLEGIGCCLGGLRGILESQGPRPSVKLLNETRRAQNVAADSRCPQDSSLDVLRRALYADSVLVRTPIHSLLKALRSDHFLVYCPPYNSILWLLSGFPLLLTLTTPASAMTKMAETSLNTPPL